MVFQRVNIDAAHRHLVANLRGQFNLRKGSHFRAAGVDAVSQCHMFAIPNAEGRRWGAP